jgi:hypothetical protein
LYKLSLGKSSKTTRETSQRKWTYKAFDRWSNGRMSSIPFSFIPHVTLKTPSPFPPLCQIVADDLALVAEPMGMESSQSAPSYAPQGGGFVSGGSNYASTSAAAPATSAPPGQRTKEEMWESYFADPSQWWDNRQGKVRG